MIQNKVPIFESLKQYAKKNVIKFHAPGHNYGRGLHNLLINNFKDFLKFDLSMIEDIDSLHQPKSSILEAEKLAASTFGADNSFFLINGSSCGIQAMLLLCCNEGDTIILPRNIHKSVVAGLIFSGAKPVFVFPEYDDDFELILNVTPSVIEKAIAANPDAKAVLIVSPNQYGVCADIQSIASVVHKYNKILLVDEAWGGHLKFTQRFPYALQSNADIVVQSLHKRLGCLSQSSILHVKGERVDINKLKNILQLLQTTSPSYLLLASMDIARMQMDLLGKKLWNDVIDMASQMRDILLKMNFHIYSKDNAERKNFIIDETMITLYISDGTEMYNLLKTRNIEAEFHSLRHVVFVLGLGNSIKDVMQLKKQLKRIPINNFVKLPVKEYINQTVLTPRAVINKKTEKVKFNESAGRICAELVCPYPPGIPSLIHGERISKEVIEYLDCLKRSNVEIHGQKDSTLETIEVIRD